jgi:hypothetical protein
MRLIIGFAGMLLFGFLSAYVPWIQIEDGEQSVHGYAFVFDPPVPAELSPFDTLRHLPNKPPSRRIEVDMISLALTHLWWRLRSGSSCQRRAYVSISTPMSASKLNTVRFVQ